MIIHTLLGVTDRVIRIYIVDLGTRMHARKDKSQTQA